MSRLLVTHCICHAVSFEEVLRYSRESDISEIEDLQARDYCCNNCLMCKPYIELVLKTGETAFEPGAYLNRQSS